MSEGESGAHWSRRQGMGCQGRCLLSLTPIQTLLPTIHSDEDKNHKGSQNHWILNILTLQSSFTMQKIEGSEDHLSWVMVAQKRDRRVGCKQLPAWVLFHPPVGGGGSVGAQSNRPRERPSGPIKARGACLTVVETTDLPAGKEVRKQLQSERNTRHIYAAKVQKGQWFLSSSCSMPRFLGGSLALIPESVYTQAENQARSWRDIHVFPTEQGWRFTVSPRKYS